MTVPARHAGLAARARCAGCGTPTITEQFMLHRHTWLQAGLPASALAVNDGRLCVGCLEERLGRLLVPADFDEAFMNCDFRDLPRSERLEDRMGGHYTATRFWLP